MTTIAPIEVPISEEGRRQAVCAAVAWAPRLIRYAARYSATPEDAEDVYQRAMEIALVRAPTSNQTELRKWLYVVVRNEAMALARARRWETSSEPDEIVDLVPTPGPEIAAEWHERHRQLRDALDTLTESERTCIALHGAGLSYGEIMECTGYTQRKVERSLVEGRSRLHAWEARMRNGGECDSIETLLIKIAEDDASAWERRRASRHVGHCGPCRAELRQLRARRVLIASLVPTALTSGTALAAQPDPGVVTETWHQISGATSVRIGSFWQSLFDAPGPMLAKLGASAAATAVIVGAATGVTRPQIQRGAGGAQAASLVAPATTAGSHPQRRARNVKPAPQKRVVAPRRSEAPAPARPPAVAAAPTAHVTPPVRRSRVVRQAAARPAPQPRGSAASEFIP